MNLKKFFNTEEGGCIIFYIVLFITIPSLAFNFIGCSKTNEMATLRQKIATQSDSIRYLEKLCDIDTAFVNEKRNEICDMSKQIALHGMEISMSAMDIASKDPDIRVRLTAMAAKAEVITDDIFYTDSIIDSLMITLKPTKNL